MKPILFSTPMVRAILAGRKTMTRRVVNRDIVNQFDIDRDGTVCAFVEQATGDGYEPTRPAPYQPGDILWVRETWAPYATIDSWLDDENKYMYKAGSSHLQNNMYIKWRPSIHMPKEAARIFLRVTEVRVERLQDISVQDAKDEGIKVHANGCVDGLAFGCYNGDDCVYNRCKRPIELFRDLWESINAKRGYGWDANPWVWVYEFERCDKPGGEE